MERGINFLLQVLGQLEEIDILDDAASMVPEMIDAIATILTSNRVGQQYDHLKFRLP